MYEIILVDYKFGGFPPIHQIKNLAKISRYTVYICLSASSYSIMLPTTSRTIIVVEIFLILLTSGRKDDNRTQAPVFIPLYMNLFMYMYVCPRVAAP